MEREEAAPAAILTPRVLFKNKWSTDPLSFSPRNSNDMNELLAAIIGQLFLFNS